MLVSPHVSQQVDTKIEYPNITITDYDLTNIPLNLFRVVDTLEIKTLGQFDSIFKALQAIDC